LLAENKIKKTQQNTVDFSLKGIYKKRKWKAKTLKIVLFLTEKLSK
jgi:hypothetical protein